MEDIDLLVGTFNRTEATVFGRGTAFLDPTAVRIALTSADGIECSQIVRVVSKDVVSVKELSEQLKATMKGFERTDIRLAAIARLLKEDLLSGTEHDNASEGSI